MSHATRVQNTGPGSPGEPVRMPPPNTPVKSWPTPNLTDLLFYVERDGKLPKYQTFERGQPYEDTEAYPHHKLVYVTPQTEERWSRWYYAADREHQDYYNFRFTSTDIGGHNFESVTRSYLIPRFGENAFVAGQPAIGSNMPRVPEEVFGHYAEDDFIVANTKQDHAGMELDSLYVALDVTYVNWCDNKSILFDESSAKVLPDETKYFGANEVVTDDLNTDNKTAAELFDDPTDGFWGLRDDGTVVDGKQISCDWYTISWRKVIGGSGEAGDYGIPIRSYTTNENFLWPGIFNRATDITILPITRYTDRSRTDTYGRYVVRISLANPPYNGPTKFTIDEYWSKEPVTLPEIVKMIPKEITFQGANYNVQLAPTLHAGVKFDDTIGTGDPEFPLNDYSQTFEATNITEWPETLIVNAVQTPFRGGYRVIIQTAHRPDFYVPYTPPVGP